MYTNEKIAAFLKERNFKGDGLSQGHIAVLRAYLDGLDDGFHNELLNLRGVWDKDVSEMVKALKHYGIKEFTLSETSTGLMGLLAGFTAEGCQIEGVIKINEGLSWDGTAQTTDAVKLKV